MLFGNIRGLRSAIEKLSLAAFAMATVVIAPLALTATQSAAQDDQSSPVAQAQPSVTAQQLAAGKVDFDKHCAPCHGTNAKGHGPEVSVIPGIKPSDLTLISRNNGGVFPYQEVADTIDGRKGVPSHKRFDMPFWGVNFQQQGNEFSPSSEAAARARINAVVAYIATLQAN
jgi:mono/diheme cytochrome c family protein